MNPHAEVALYCVAGIIVCAALIVGGWVADRRGRRNH